MISQLQAEIESLQVNRLVPRPIRLLHKQLRSFAAAKSRKSRSLAKAWYRKQYFLTSAHKDLLVYARKNEDISLAVLIATAAMGYATVAAWAELAYTFFFTAYTASELSGANMLILAAVAGGTLIISLVWVFAFLFNAFSIAIMQGANRTKYRSLRKTLRQGLRLAGRSSLLLLATLALIALPVLVVGIATAAYILTFAGTTQEVGTIVPLSAAAAAAALLGGLVVFGLAPVVGVFEQHLSYRGVFSRSRALVRRRGKAFMLCVYLALAAVAGGAYGVALLLNTLFNLSQTLVMGLLLFAAAVYVNGISVVFYRKRRLARVN